MTDGKAARLRHRNDGVEARGLDGIADHVGTIANSPPQKIQAPIRTELIGSGRRPKEFSGRLPLACKRSVRQSGIAVATGGESQDSAVPIAQARIVIGCQYSFIYIPHCPLCGLEHSHGEFSLNGQGSDPLQAFDCCRGHRASHCFCQGPGRDARLIGGQWCTVFVYPPEWHEPDGESYRLVLGPEPACFTPRGIKSPHARLAMATLARKGVATSLQILTPRRPFVLLAG
jgi:hypothetical protein